MSPEKQGQPPQRRHRKLAAGGDRSHVTPKSAEGDRMAVTRVYAPPRRDVGRGSVKRDNTTPVRRNMRVNQGGCR